MTIKEFREILKNKPEDEMDAQFFLRILIHHFLGKDWYFMYWFQNDINAEAVMDILRIYPRASIKRAYYKVFGQKLDADRNKRKQCDYGNKKS